MFCRSGFSPGGACDVGLKPDLQGGGGGGGGAPPPPPPSGQRAWSLLPGEDGPPSRVDLSTSGARMAPDPCKRKSEWPASSSASPTRSAPSRSKNGAQAQCAVHDARGRDHQRARAQRAPAGPRRDPVRAARRAGVVRRPRYRGAADGRPRSARLGRSALPASSSARSRNTTRPSSR